MTTLTNCSRRDFINATGLSVSGLIVGFRAFSSSANAQSGATGQFEPNAFVSISKTEGVVLSIAIPEVGQNTRTAYAMIISDELGADMGKVSIRQSHPRDDIGRQGAVGSSGIRRNYLYTREATAAAREMLIAAAAKQWNTSASNCRTENSFVLGPGGKRISFEDIADEASKQRIPVAAKLKDRSDFNYIGTDVRCVDTRDIVTGKTQFSIDAMPENLAFAVMLRCPVHQGKLRSFDDSAARAIPGVKDIIQIGDKIAVIASNTWIAINASRAVNVQWNEGRNSGVDDDKLDAERKRAVRNPRLDIDSKGNFESAYAKAAKQVEGEFFVPIISHANMEAANATAWYHDGGIEIWAGCQQLTNLYRDLPEITGLSHDKITYHSLRMGGGFGRKLAYDYVEEAVSIAKEVDYPVKMINSREDDLRTGRFRNPDHYLCKAGLDRNGYPEAIGAVSTRNLKVKDIPELFREVDHFSMKATPVRAPRQGSALRAPGHNITNFVEQSLIDIMADEAGIDAMDYQLAINGDRAAMRSLGWRQSIRTNEIVNTLLLDIRRRSNWKSDPDYGYGVSTFSGYGSHIVIVALVPKKGGTRPVEKVFAGVHCGQVINQLGARAQIEGSIIDALSATLYQKITMREGRVAESNFHDYKLLRMPEHPEIDVDFVPSIDEPQGLGEPAYPPMMAATTNAIYNATGNRHTVLPIRS